jgi:hypothetical protein
VKHNSKIKAKKTFFFVFEGTNKAPGDPFFTGSVSSPSVTTLRVVFAYIGPASSTLELFF